MPAKVYQANKNEQKAYKCHSKQNWTVSERLLET